MSIISYKIKFSKYYLININYIKMGFVFAAECLKVLSVVQIIINLRIATEIIINLSQRLNV